MEPDMKRLVEDSKIIRTFTGFYMHEFIENSKKKVAEGTFMLPKGIV